MTQTPSGEHGVLYRPFPPFAEWRAVTFDDRVFARTERRLIQRRQEAGEEALQAAVEMATRSAAVDTGAIEGLYQVDRGFTRTVATQAAAWEATIAQKGEHVVRAIEDALAAYEFVLDAATRNRQISETWIRDLHSTICASQETYTVHTAVGPQQHPLPKGAYKLMPNNPSNPSAGVIHHYAPVIDTPAEMARLVEELRGSAFESAHPVLQAAYAHYAYVLIHPFADGNGRVARALASVYLYRRPGVPLVVFADQRVPYLDALEAADQGRSAAFVNFIETCTVDTMGIILASVHKEQPPLAASLAEIESFYTSAGNLVPYDDAAVRLGALLLQEINEQLEALPLPEAVQAKAYNIDTPPPVPPEYRLPNRASSSTLRLTSEHPARADLFLHTGVFVSVDLEKNPDLVIASDIDDEVLDVAVREVSPTVTATLRLKLKGYVEGQIAAAMSRLAAAGRAAQQASGR